MSTTRRVRLLTKQDIADDAPALSLLDAAMESSELLMAIAPIRVITVGGMLAVSLFGNRLTTKDIDFMLDPNIDAVPEYRQEILRVISDVADLHDFNQDWMNDDLRVFIRRRNRLNLFLQSVEQGVVAYQGENLVVFAGRLDFALERKLRRLNERDNRPRDLDLSDAVTLVHSLKGDSQPLNWAEIRALDENEMGMPVEDRGIRAVALRYIQVYGTQGIVQMEWDKESQRNRYRDLRGEWAYV